MSSPTAAEDQARLLDDAITVVRQQSQVMRKCLETPGKLMDALKSSSTFVSELRMSNLGPKQYYELYMAVFDALRHLSVFLQESHPSNHLADLYELVQYAGNIIPRLYLMITVGTAYMAIEGAPVKEIMKDMMEMSRGVQHPVRGLFLRYYLSGQARDHLPKGSGDGPEGNLQDSISFILTNFVEMNKLWVRLQHQGHSREREQRTKERQQLQLLVGNNLERLSQLVDLQSYKESILQPLLEQVVQCRDVLAQEYLLEVIIQVFPDEYHLHTLDQFLQATQRLNPQVNVKSIVIGLMDRLSAYAARESDSDTPEEKKKTEEEALAKLLADTKLSDDAKKSAKESKDSPKATAEDTGTNGTTAKQDSASSTTAVSEGQPESEASTNGDLKASQRNRGIPESVNLYHIFYSQVMDLVREQRLPIQDTTALLVSLTNLALSIYPDHLEYVDQILDYAQQKVSEHQNSADLHGPASQNNILRLLLAPIESFSSLFTALNLPHYLPLLESQTYSTRRSIANRVVRTILDSRTKITTPANLERVLGTLRVLIRESSHQPSEYSTLQAHRRTVDTEDVLEEQTMLAKMVHLINSADNDTQFDLLQMTRKAYNDGNDRVKVTTPALITASIKLARRLKRREHFDDNWSMQSKALYRFMHNTIATLYARVTAAGVADLSLRLFVACGQVADQTDAEETAYECFVQAFTIYEESISDSRAQYQAVCVIAGALHSTRRFTRENYDTLITKCALHGSKLLKKPDQCRAVYLASHLWWAVEPPTKEGEEPPELYRDDKRVLECLQRALRVADACMDASVSVELFVEILNRYVYYYEQGNKAVTTKYLNGLIELIHSNLQTHSDSTSLEGPKRHFERTLEYIRSRDYTEVVTDPRPA